MILQPPLEDLTDKRVPDRVRIVHALAEFRRAWQTFADDMSLVEVESPVGLLLSDIADRLELTPEERHTLLGGKLINEVNAFMEQRIPAKLSA